MTFDSATEPVETVAEVLRLGDEVGYPLIVKAAAGGGGKGMKLVASPDYHSRDEIWELLPGATVRVELHRGAKGDFPLAVRP